MNPFQEALRDLLARMVVAVEGERIVITGAENPEQAAEIADGIRRSLQGQLLALELGDIGEEP